MRAQVFCLCAVAVGLFVVEGAFAQVCSNHPQPDPANCQSTGGCKDLPVGAECSSGGNFGKCTPQDFDGNPAATPCCFCDTELVEGLPRVKVKLNFVTGSGVTADQMKGWFNKAKTIWSDWITLVQDGAPKEAANTAANRAAGAITLYGTALAPAPPGNPGNTTDQAWMQVGAAGTGQILAHEIGHWFGAKPDQTTGEHGTPMGDYPGFPDFSDSDTDGDGDADADDRKNMMYPGVARTASEIDDKQCVRAQNNAMKWLTAVAARDRGRGRDEPDKSGDHSCPCADIQDHSIWGYGLDPFFTLHMTVLVEELGFDVPTELGFLIESDQNPDTGEPDTGFDYFVGYDPLRDQPILRRYDDSWTELSSEGVVHVIEYRWMDSPEPEIPLGVELSMPEALLERRGIKELICYVAMATDFNEIDFSPNEGTVCISTEELTITDCNGNGVPDEQDIAEGFSPDTDGNGIPDECEGAGIPAVSEWGLVLMTLVALTAAAIVFHRRRPAA